MYKGNYSICKFLPKTLISFFLIASVDPDATHKISEFLGRLAELNLKKLMLAAGTQNDLRKS
jgi:hypothetical protein